MKCPEGFLDRRNDRSKHSFSLQRACLTVHRPSHRCGSTQAKDRQRAATGRLIQNMTLQDPQDDDRDRGARSDVVRYTTEGADEHINKRSLKNDEEPWTDRERQR